MAVLGIRPGSTCMHCSEASLVSIVMLVLDTPSRIYGIDTPPHVDRRIVQYSTVRYSTVQRLRSRVERPEDQLIDPKPCPELLSP